MMGYLFFLFSFIVLFAFYKNKDPFSPSKVYLVIFFTFFGEIFWLEQQYIETYLVTLVILLFANVIIFTEKRIKCSSFGQSVFSKRESKRFIKILWLLTLIPLIAQVYFVNELGGLIHFVSSVGGRVKDWQGFGAIIFLIKVMNVISYIYFIVLLKTPKSKFKTSLYLLHFILFIIIALLSGSRSNLLWNVVFMLIFYHYSSKQVNILHAFLGFVIVLTVAMVVGVAREGYSIEDDGNLKSGIDIKGKVLEMANFHYGLQSLEKLLEFNNISDRKYGATYITVFTNLVPRTIWPEKPDTGGVIITKEYFGDPFGGFSNYTTGLLPEGIINFGFVVGCVFSAFFLLLIYLIFFKYLNYFQHLPGKKGVIALGAYPFFLTSIPAYLYAEFTTNTISLLLFKYGLYLIVFKVVITKITIRRNNNF